MYAPNPSCCVGAEPSHLCKRCQALLGGRVANADDGFARFAADMKYLADNYEAIVTNCPPPVGAIAAPAAPMIQLYQGNAVADDSDNVLPPCEIAWNEMCSPALRQRHEQEQHQRDSRPVVNTPARPRDEADNTLPDLTVNWRETCSPGLARYIEESEKQAAAIWGPPVLGPVRD